jgi:RNA 2',3'-cyclic 3'-phosphodiesterase
LHSIRKVRLFAAIEISDEAIKEFTRLIDFLKDKCAGVKWVRPDNIHLTMRFLGEVDEDDIACVSDAIRRTAHGCGPFEIVTGEPGVFPTWKSPRVIWVGLTSGENEICNLAGRLDSLLVPCGFHKEEKTFVPHITVGRVKGYKNLDFIKQAALKAGVRHVSIGVEHITLFSSELSREGAVHTPLERFMFRVTPH